ncbi:MAG: DNA-3-methyladenine glycosylase I [Pseudomonadota bacterium]
MNETCDWVGDDPLYQRYHDAEWGRPVTESRALWEALILEGFQAGLSWITILRKREDFRIAFAGFEPDVIAHWGAKEVDDLLQNPKIIRHRGKIEGTIAGAKIYQRIQSEYGFARYIWDFVEGRPLQPMRHSLADVPAQTDLSNKLSKDLKAQGFKFCGPTITYAFMQAVGLINDHVVTCPQHQPVKRLGLDMPKRLQTGFG